MIQGLTYAILTTGDVPRARRFFTAQLGLGTEEEQGDVFSQFTTREGTLGAIREATPADSPPGVERYLQVAAADAAYRTWRERGVDLVTPPHDEPFGRTFACRDPDGRILHAVQPA